MPDWDIIPDIHGQAVKLEGMLTRLGYRETTATRGGASTWRHPTPFRKAIFLGDFIDRGPDQVRVLEIARGMTGEGEALAVMGNHELNALHYATDHPVTGRPLRVHSRKNAKQHAAFLEAFPPGSRASRDALAWMGSLPLFLDLGTFRVAHACWSQAAVRSVRRRAPNGVLRGDLLVEAAMTEAEFGAAVDVIAKGPEIDLPPGCSFVDGGGVCRTKARLAWWNGSGRRWREIVASVPDPDACLPDAEASAEATALVYPADDVPVFVGHYWLNGSVEPRSQNVFCLDYSAGKDGPLVAYRQAGEGAAEHAAFDPARITVHGG